MNVMKINSSSKKNIFFCELLLLIFINIYFNEKKINEIEMRNLPKLSNKKDYENLHFAIIQRLCSECGLLSFFIVHLGCIHSQLLAGYIPIIDLKSFPNLINGYNTSHNNYWELFFEQPFGYTLEEVLKNAKNIKYVKCQDCSPRPDSTSMIYNEVQINFWRNMLINYMQIKKEIMDLSMNLTKKLFNNSKNILGVLTRGTDYISRRPKGHPIPPDINDLIKDVKKMDDKYRYDYIFFTTEDEKMRDLFEKSFINKIRQIKPKIRINYDYSGKKTLAHNENIRGNIEYNKIYLLNVIILSKSLDIATARCTAAAGIFILSNGFRNKKIYDLGLY